MITLSPIQLLLVEDNPGDARLLREHLSIAGPGRFDLILASTLAEGLACLQDMAIDAILLDLGLPDSQGLDTFYQARRAAREEAPILVLTGLDDDVIALQAMNEGAQDYLVKDHIDSYSLSRAIRYALERQRLMRSLRASEARFRVMIENNADGILIVSQEGLICFANPAAEALFSRSRPDLLGMPFGFPLVADEIRRLDLLRENDEFTTVEMRMVAIDWEGKPAYLASLRDVTRQVHAQTMVHNIAKFPEENPSPVLRINQNGVIVYANEASLPLLENWNCQVGEPVPAEWQEIAASQFESGRLRVIELSVAGRALAIAVVPVIGAGYVNLYAADISERVAAEAEVHKFNTELEMRVQARTAELEAANLELEAFTYSVSHDLRAPLRAIDGFSRIVLEDYAEQMPAEAERYLNRVRENAQQMDRLIQDLLALSRLGRADLHKQTIDPAELVRHALRDLHVEREGRQVELTLDELPTTQGDPALLKQVFVNLLSNALKFTRPREVALIEIGYQEQNGKSAYFVRDNGVGFDMRYADKLFGVFQRLHHAEDFEGTGVGLAIVQRVVNRHGGRVWADAAPDQGATIYFSLGEGHN